jgi:hypothetical protein
MEMLQLTAVAASILPQELATNIISLCVLKEVKWE